MLCVKFGMFREEDFKKSSMNFRYFANVSLREAIQIPFTLATLYM